MVTTPHYFMRWSVRVPRLWGWVPVAEFDSAWEARSWLAQFGPIDGRLFPPMTQEGSSDG